MRRSLLSASRPLLLALLIAALAAALTAGALIAAEPTTEPPTTAEGAVVAAEGNAMAKRNAALRAQIRKERKASRSRLARARKIADERVKRASASSPAGVDSEQAVRLAAIAYGLPEERMLRIARCESGLDPSARAAGLYLGLFQFGTPLWATTPYAEYGRDNAQAAALAASWAFARGMDSHWPVCGKR